MSWIPFKQLAVGESFRFAYGWPPSRLSTHVLQKVSATQYQDPRGERFTTGAKSAVVSLSKE